MTGPLRAISRAGSADLTRFPPTACYSQAHYEAIGGALDNARQISDAVFVDSITAASRLASAGPNSSRKPSQSAAAKGVRGAYGLHAREMIAGCINCSMRAE